MITLACLGLAGTTVAANGLADAFRLALGTASEIDIGYVHDMMGMPTIVAFRNLLDGDEAAAQAANKRFERTYREALGSVSPIAGAHEAIVALRRSGIRVCLTTGFSAAIRDAVLEALDWQTVADLTLTPEEAIGRRGPPHPDVVLTALRLGVDDVRDVAVVGDNANDLVGAWRSGASLVAGVLTGAQDRATLVAAPHTHILDSIAELPAVVAIGSP